MHFLQEYAGTAGTDFVNGFWGGANIQAGKKIEMLKNAKIFFQGSAYRLTVNYPNS